MKRRETIKRETAAELTASCTCGVSWQFPEKTTSWYSRRDVTRALVWQSIRDHLRRDHWRTPKHASGVHVVTVRETFTYAVARDEADLLQQASTSKQRSELANPSTLEDSGKSKLGSKLEKSRNAGVSAKSKKRKP